MTSTEDGEEVILNRKELSEEEEEEDKMCINPDTQLYIARVFII